MLGSIQLTVLLRITWATVALHQFNVSQETPHLKIFIKKKKKKERVLTSFLQLYQHSLILLLSYTCTEEFDIHSGVKELKLVGGEPHRVK